jgi:hypothetical protein
VPLAEVMKKYLKDVTNKKTGNLKYSLDPQYAILNSSAISELQDLKTKAPMFFELINSPPKKVVYQNLSIS